jgi:hypothetical protein
MSTSIAGYRALAADLPAALERVARRPEVAREAARYLDAVGSIKSIDDFLGNQRVYRFAMRAFGLDDMIYAKAFVRRALSEGVDAADSLANRLADPRLRELAQAFNFKRYGAATTSFSRTQQGTVDRYVRQVLETEAGSGNEAIRLALYFERKAATVTSPYALLADRALLKVTQVALGLPESTGVLDIDRQAQMIEKRLAVADLDDPAKVQKLLTRFLAVWDIDHADPTRLTPIALTGSSGTIATDTGLLGRMQTLRRKS